MVIADGKRRRDSRPDSVILLEAGGKAWEIHLGWQEIGASLGVRSCGGCSSCRRGGLLKELQVAILALKGVVRLAWLERLFVRRFGFG